MNFPGKNFQAKLRAGRGHRSSKLGLDSIYLHLVWCLVPGRCLVFIQEMEKGKEDGREMNDSNRIEMPALATCQPVTKTNQRLKVVFKMASHF